MKFREFKESWTIIAEELRQGSPGNYENQGLVKQVQTILTRLGYNVGPEGIDGKYGPNTARAVAAFKADYKLSGGGSVFGEPALQTIEKIASGKIKPVKAYAQTDSDTGVTSGGLKGSEAHTAAKKVIEDYLGEEITSSEYEMLIRATAAEASPNARERAGVLAVILNRVKNNYGSHGSDIRSQLMARNQFQAVTGVPGDRRPSENYTDMSASTGERVANDIIAHLPNMRNNWMNFTSNNPKAYGRGTNINFMYAMRNSPGARVIGQTVFGTA